MLLCCLAALVALVGVPGFSRASGCTITWVGDVNNDWYGGQGTANTNWNDDTIPDTNDHVCLNNLGSPYTVTLPSTTTVNHYSIQSQVTLVLNGFLRAEADSSNAGTINFNGSGTGLQTEDGNAATTETLTNTGTINSLGPGGGASAQRWAGDVANQGTISVAHPNLVFRDSYEARAPKLTNTGTVTLAGGGALLVVEGASTPTTFLQGSGATINGPGTLTVGAYSRLQISGGQIASSADVNLSSLPILDFVGAAGASGHVNIGCCATRVSGDVPSGFTLDVLNSGQLRAVANWTNAGTINLAETNAGLSTEDGDSTTTETLTNTGTIALFGPSGGATQRGIGGDLVNQGTISVDHPNAVFHAANESRVPKLTNTATGTITVAAGGLLTADAQPLPNAGTLKLAGKLITNSYSQSAGGTFAVDVSGTNPGSEHGQLYANDTVSLAGTIRVATPGFTPSGGQEFTIIDAPAPPDPSRTGTFTTKAPANCTYDVIYSATNVKLGSVSACNPTTQCSDGIDNDGDGNKDFGTGANNDRGCSSASDDSESPDPPQCSDGFDNDGDGKTDFGSGAGNDPGCSSPTDGSESPDPGPTPPQCSDGFDNDGDGKTDFGSGANNDPGCSSASDDSESPDPAPTGDSDGDGVPNSSDSCPTQPGPAGFFGCPDTDSDGLPDFADNCPTAANPQQENSDGDAQGDACDADDDNDGKADSVDRCPTQAANTADGCPVVPPPRNTALPEISGTPAVGETLSCSLGTWEGSPTGFSHQWERNGSQLTAESSSIYVVEPGDIQKTLTCTVHATNSAGTTRATSHGVQIPAPPPRLLEGPQIRGNPLWPDNVTCDPGRWANGPIRFSFKWTLQGHPGNPFTRRQAFIPHNEWNFLFAGNELACEVTATNGAGETTATARTAMKRCNFSYSDPDAPPRTAGRSRCSETPIPELAAWETYPTNQFCRKRPGTSCAVMIPIEASPGVPYIFNADGSVTLSYLQLEPNGQAGRQVHTVLAFAAELLRGGVGAGASVTSASAAQRKRGVVRLGRRRFSSRRTKVHRVRLRLPKSLRRALRRGAVVKLVTRQTTTGEGKRPSTLTFRTKLARPPKRARRCIVPRLRGRSLATALRLLDRTRCKLGPITFQDSTSQPADRIIAQSPRAGRKRRRPGTAVSLTVTRAP